MNLNIHRNKSTQSLLGTIRNYLKKYETLPLNTNRHRKMIIIIKELQTRELTESQQQLIDKFKQQFGGSKKSTRKSKRRSTKKKSKRRSN